MFCQGNPTNNFESSIQPHFYYSDIIYDQPNNEYVSQKIESYQYNADLTTIPKIQQLTEHPSLKFGYNLRCNATTNL